MGLVENPYWQLFCGETWPAYSTVTDFAKFLGLSTSVPRASAEWYASSCNDTTCRIGDSKP